MKEDSPAPSNTGKGSLQIYIPVNTGLNHCTTAFET